MELIPVKHARYGTMGKRRGKGIPEISGKGRGKGER